MKVWIVVAMLVARIHGELRAQCDSLSVADFDAPSVCTGEAVEYFNLSEGFSPNAVYEWDYETDGQPDFIGFVPPPYVFPGPGSYLTTLTVFDDGGCVAFASRTVIVRSAAAQIFLPESVCSIGGPYLLTGSPPGGTFSGLYVYADAAGNFYFNPSSVVGSEIVTIVYQGVNAEGCAFSVSRTVQVRTPVAATITGLAPSYCTGPACVVMSASPGGGFFSGPGVNGNLFCPGAAGAGTHTIVYQVPGGDGCPVLASRTVTVRQTPSAQILGAEPSYCPAAPCDTLVGVPAGGSFSGPGMVGNRFCPSLAGLGTHTLRYTGSQNGCSYVATVQVTVAAPTQTATISGLAGTYCSNSLCVALFGNPAGGTFSGPGVTGSRFCPAAAGPGTHVVSYTVDLGNGCVLSASRTVTVNAAPVASLSGLNALYCLPAADCSVLSGTPPGGTFSGPGVSGDVFCPSAAGPGTHVIRYSGRVNGCSYTAVRTVVVRAPVPVSIVGPERLCQSDAPVVFGATVPGGTFSGPGIEPSGALDPSTLLPGTYLIAYTGINDGCAFETYRNLEIAPAPEAYVFPLAPKYCRTDTLIALRGFPQGGEFAGPGVVRQGQDYYFNPALVEAGFQQFVYSGTTADGCPYVASAVTSTIQPPVPQISNLNRFYCS
ncbi:MAG: hypothetical protein RMM53_09395, partial [Bacteroidia bacterium]|nr:hypothetical protein [Bacteroidia bacterium]MDW8334415.1 hypothetical protein [Bacteroidia bacterium]